MYCHVIKSRSPILYSGKFSRVLIFAVFADQGESAKFYTSKISRYTSAWASSSISSEKELSCLKIDFSSLPGPPLKMASNSSPEVNAITIRTHDFMLALSNEPVGVAGILLGKGFISNEVMSKMLVVSYTSTEKAAILIEAMRNKIELAPSKFAELLEVLSEVECAKEVVDSLRSTYQSELHSRLGHTKWTFCYSSYRNL